MTNDRPEVVAWVISAYVPYSGFERHVCMSEDDARHSRATFEWLKGEVEEVLLINLSDYEALQAELETVKKVAYGNIELLERNEALQAECEKLRKDAERYRFLRDAEELPMNLMRLDMIGDLMDSAVDAALATCRNQGGEA